MASVTFQEPAPIGVDDSSLRQAMMLGAFLLLSLMLHAAVVLFVPDSIDEGAAGFGSGGTVVSLGPSGREAGGEVAPAAGATESAEAMAAPEAESVESFEAIEDVAAEPVTDVRAAREVAPVETLSDSALEPVSLSELAPLEPVSSEPMPSVGVDPAVEVDPSPVSEALAAQVREIETAERVETQEVVEVEPVQRPVPPVPQRRPLRQKVKSNPQPQNVPPKAQQQQRADTESMKPEATATGARDDAGETQSEQQVAGEGGRSGRSGSSEAGDGDNTAGGGPSGAQSDYYRQVLAWLERHKRYPRRSKLRNEQGVVMLRFVVSRDGSVSASAIKQSSGHRRLDKEALGMVERAQPLPAMPADMGQAEIKLVIPVEFELR